MIIKPHEKTELNLSSPLVKFLVLIAPMIHNSAQIQTLTKAQHEIVPSLTVHHSSVMLWGSKDSNKVCNYLIKVFGYLFNIHPRP